MPSLKTSSFSMSAISWLGSPLITTRSACLPALSVAHLPCSVSSRAFEFCLRHSQKTKQPAGECSTGERPDHRYRSIAPIRAAFARDWQQSVRHARAQVASRIYRVTGGAAQRKTDSPNEAPYQIRSQRSRSAGRNGLGKNRSHNKHQHRCPDDFADQVGYSLPYRGVRAKTRQLRGRVRRFFPVRQVMQPNQRGARHRAKKLRGDVRQAFAKRSCAHREAQRYRRIQVRVAAAAGHCGEHPRHHRKRPSRRDDQPPAAFTLRALQQHARHYAVSKQYQDHGAQEFSQEWRCHPLFPLLCTIMNLSSQTSARPPSSIAGTNVRAGPLPCLASTVGPWPNSRATAPAPERNPRPAPPRTRRRAPLFPESPDAPLRG